MTTTQEFKYTGSVQRLTIPAGTTSVVIEKWGADGGNYLDANGVKHVGGKGDYERYTYDVTGLAYLDFYVGRRGCDGGPFTKPPAGYGPGWNGGAGSTTDPNYMTALPGTAGDATDVRSGGTGLANRIGSAAGGGGAGTNGDGGDANGTTGNSGVLIPELGTHVLTGGVTGWKVAWANRNVTNFPYLSGTVSAADLQSWLDTNYSGVGLVVQSATPGSQYVIAGPHVSGQSAFFDRVGWQGPSGSQLTVTNTANSVIVGAGGTSSQGGQNSVNTYVNGNPAPPTYAALGQGSTGTHAATGGSSVVGGAGGGGLYGGGRGAGVNSAGSQLGGGGGAGSSAVPSSSRVSNVVIGRQADRPNPSGNGDGYARASYNTVPPAPTVTSPSNNGKVVANQSVVIAVRSNDPDPNDGITAVDVQYKANGATDWTVLSSLSITVNPNDPYSATADWATSFPQGTSIEFQVRNYDKSNAQGAWSSSYFVTASAPPGAATINAPTSGAMVSQSPVLLDVTVPAGYDVVAWQTRRTNPAGTTTYFDSGSTMSLTAIPLDAVSGRTDRLQVRYSAAGYWSPWAYVDVDVELGPPPAASVSWAPDLANRGIVFAWVTGAPNTSLGQSPATSADVYVTDETRPDPVRIGANLPPSYSILDLSPYTATADNSVQVQCTVVTRADNGATTSSTAGGLETDPGWIPGADGGTYDGGVYT